MRVQTGEHWGHTLGFRPWHTVAVRDTQDSQPHTSRTPTNMCTGFHEVNISEATVSEHQQPQIHVFTDLIFVFKEFTGQPSVYKGNWSVCLSSQSHSSGEALLLPTFPQLRRAWRYHSCRSSCSTGRDTTSAHR